MSPEEVEALGTEEYIQWVFSDTSVENRDNPLAVVTVFLTYYTGAPDQVPHIPNVCYLGSGFSIKDDYGISFSMPALGDLGKDVPLQVVTFEKAGMFRRLSPTVCYLFSVNGKLKGSRDAVRLALSNPRDRYAYFSKIEVRFGRGFVDPPPEEVVRAAKEVMSTLLPILVNNHYPEWPPKIRERGSAGAQASSE